MKIKLSDKLIIEIRDKLIQERRKPLRQRIPQAEIAKEYKIGHALANKILHESHLILGAESSDEDEIASGKKCADCGIYFTNPSGQKVSCKDCITWRVYGKKPIIYPLSKYKEVEADKNLIFKGRGKIGCRED